MSDITPRPARIYKSADILNMTQTKVRFERKISYEPNSGCWLWEASIRDRGYGEFSIQGYAERAHRIAWLLYRGDIGSLHVLHSCDMPACVNPDHLFLGTREDNVADMVKKNRSARQKGELCGTSKLRNAQVVAILNSKENGPALERKFNISRFTIHKIRRGETWSHISGIKGSPT